ncbi:exopolysaccharide biosynthesis protein [Salinisphaera sp. T5B8]|uniref:GumC family protein n=1 Tax=unclassified Salinisphaera TaxID=2649847 RepID=UPI0033412F4A
MNAAIDRPLIPGMRATPTVGQIVRAVRAHWRTVAVTVAVFFVLAIIAALMMRSYEARASLVIEFPTLDPLTGQARSSALAESYRATQIDLMTSQNVMLGVVDQLGLADDPAVRDEFDADGDGEGTLRQRLASALGEKVEVRAGEVSQLLVVSYRGDDPKRSAAIVNAVIDQYMKASENMATDPARQRLGQYSNFLDGLRKKVDEAQDALTNARQRFDVIDSAAAEGVDTSRLNDLGTRLNAAQARLQAAQAEVDQINGARASGQPMTAQADILDSNVVQDLKNRLVGFQAERAEIAESLGPNHPRLRAIDGQIATVRSRLRDEIDASLAAARQSVKAARGEVNALQQNYDAARADVMDKQTKRGQLDSYRRRLESATQVYEAALSNYDQVLGGSELSAQNVSVVTRAIAPTKTAGLSGKRKLAVALVFGLVVGVMLALLQELLDRRVRAPEDIERELELPVLGVLGHGALR